MVRSQSDADLKLQKQLMDAGEIPNHIAIIMDGNGRWAKKKGLPRAAGHKRGVDSVRDIVRACAQIGVKYLTLYTFSTENWNRPKDEVSMLMRLLLRTLKDETNELNQNNVRLSVIGDIQSLPESVQKQLQDAVEKTKNNTKLNLNLALSYSGRWELLEAFKSIAALSAEGKLKLDDINEQCVANHLTTRGIPDPDLLIRTSGEFRVSNFLLWQIAYTEFYISEAYWPDFRRKQLYEAITDFQKRERRFGRVSEQINKNVKGLKNGSDLPKETV